MYEIHRPCPQAVVWLDGVWDEGDWMARMTWIHTQTLGPCGPEVTSKRIHTCRVTLGIMFPFFQIRRSSQFKRVTLTTELHMSFKKNCVYFSGESTYQAVHCSYRWLLVILFYQIWIQYWMCQIFSNPFLKCIQTLTFKILTNVTIIIHWIYIAHFKNNVISRCFTKL